MVSRVQAVIDSLGADSMVVEAERFGHSMEGLAAPLPE